MKKYYGCVTTSVSLGITFAVCRPGFIGKGGGVVSLLWNLCCELQVIYKLSSNAGYLHTCDEKAGVLYKIMILRCYFSSVLRSSVCFAVYFKTLH